MRERVRKKRDEHKGKKKRKFKIRSEGGSLPPHPPRFLCVSRFWRAAKNDENRTPLPEIVEKGGGDKNGKIATESRRSRKSQREGTGGLG